MLAICGPTVSRNHPIGRDAHCHQWTVSEMTLSVSKVTAGDITAGTGVELDLEILG